jgi:hypothetical protein
MFEDTESFEDVNTSPIATIEKPEAALLETDLPETVLPETVLPDFLLGEYEKPAKDELF